MTGLVILAAGESSRLGEPKQKLLYNGKTLLEQAVETGINSCCRPIIIILGAFVEEIQLNKEERPIFIYYNPQWKEGMASSVRLGIRMLQETEPMVTEAIIMVCDQPYVNSELLNDLINTKTTTGKDVVASSYNNTLGVPVLFDKKLFPELMSLEGNAGAKQLLIERKDSLVVLPFPLGGIDIDTQNDYKNLIS